MSKGIMNLFMVLCPKNVFLLCEVFLCSIVTVFLAIEAAGIIEINILTSLISAIYIPALSIILCGSLGYWGNKTTLFFLS